MNSNYEPSGFDPRIEALARRAGAERSLYLGEAIGHGLVVAWNALGTLGGFLRRAAKASPAKTTPGTARA